VNMTKREAQAFVCSKLLRLEREDASENSHPYQLYRNGECVAHGSDKVHCAAKVVGIRVVGVKCNIIEVSVEFLGAVYTELWSPDYESEFSTLIDIAICDALATACEEPDVELRHLKDGQGIRQCVQK